MNFRMVLLTVVAASLISADFTEAQICGDANGSGSVNIADMTFLSAYVFEGGSPPPNFFTADCDNYEGITIGDMSLILRRLCCGGRFPVCPPANPPLGTLDSAYRVSYSSESGLLAGETVDTVIVALEIPINYTRGITLPLKFRYGSDTPSIDTIIYADPSTLGGNIIFSSYFDDDNDGVAVIATMDLFGGLGIKAGVTVLAKVVLSLPPSDSARAVSAEFSALTPAQAPVADSSIRQLVGTESGIPGAIIVSGVIPVIVSADFDEDGLLNWEDNCPSTANLNQSDLDGDSFGDACDNCTHLANVGQENADGDALGDICDLCPDTPDLCPECCVTPGDANYDGSVNIGDATFLIQWIFSGGAEPLCFHAADANGSSTMNISDATYIIAYIFSGGSAPICGSTGT